MRLDAITSHWGFWKRINLSNPLRYLVVNSAVELFLTMTTTPVLKKNSDFKPANLVEKIALCNILPTAENWSRYICLFSLFEHFSHRKNQSIFKCLKQHEDFLQGWLEYRLVSFRMFNHKWNCWVFFFFFADYKHFLQLYVFRYHVIFNNKDS